MENVIRTMPDNMYKWAMYHGYSHSSLWGINVEYFHMYLLHFLVVKNISILKSKCQ